MKANDIISPELWNKLLVPISPDKPAGEFLNYDPVYDQIQNARKEEDDRLPQGIWQKERKRAEWRYAEELCIDALSFRTRDLQVAAWLLEAWYMRHQIPGLVCGLKLIHELCERFWVNIYPPLHTDDPEYRMAPFVWINEKIRERLSLVILAQPRDSGARALLFSDWISATRPVTKKTDGNEDGSRITMDVFRKIQTQTPSAYYKELARNLDDAIEETIRIETFVAKKDNSQQGILNLLREELRKIRDFCRVTLGERGENLAPSRRQNNTLSTPCDTGSQEREIPMDQQIQSPENNMIPVISNREEAYRMLAEAADILSRIEPHSPTPYLVRRAISWGSMSLAELMAEMVHDKNNLSQITELLGFNKENRD